MARNIRFQVGEWYHCYSRGVDKRTVFEDEKDALRFMELLYLANDTQPLRREEVVISSPSELFSYPRKEALVSVGAYVLMPNHYHLILRETTEKGISAFMQKLGTAYTMYFNAKRERVGNLFVKPFRAKHLNNDRYFQHAVRYVHLNPAELFEPGWKEGVVGSKEGLAEKLISYSYSSLADHVDQTLPKRAILGNDIFDTIQSVSTQELVNESFEYYREIDSSL